MNPIAEMAVHEEPMSEKAWLADYMDKIRWSAARNLSGKPYVYLSAKLTALVRAVAVAIFWGVFIGGLAAVVYVIVEAMR